MGFSASCIDRKHSLACAAAKYPFSFLSPPCFGSPRNFPTLHWVPPPLPPPATFIKAQFGVSIQFMEECEDRTEWGLSTGRELSGCLNASAAWGQCVRERSAARACSRCAPWLQRVLRPSRPGEGRRAGTPSTAPLPQDAAWLWHLPGTETSEGGVKTHACACTHPPGAFLSWAPSHPR